MKKLILWLPSLFPLYVIRFKLGPFPTTALEIAFVALALFVTWKKGWRVWRDGCANTAQWHLPAALWMLATLMAVAVAPNHLAALGLWRAYVLEPMLYALLLAATIEHDEDRVTVVTALVAAVMFVAIMSILQYIGILPIPHPWNTDFVTRRATGPFPFPNAVALFCAPISALCIGILLHPSSLPFVRGRSSHNLHLARGEWRGSTWRAIFLVGFLFGTLATILAKSVGGFLAILVATLIALFWTKKTRRATCVIAIILVSAIAVTSKLRTPTLSYLTFNEWSGKVRLVTWRETWIMLKNHAMFGAGLGSYPTTMKPYHTHRAIEIFQYPHNILLNLWSETGVLGIFAFGWICVVWVRCVTRNAKRETSDITSDASRFTLYAALPLIALLIHGLVDVPYFKNDLAFLFWTLAILATAQGSPLQKSLP